MNKSGLYYVETYNWDSRYNNNDNRGRNGPADFGGKEETGIAQKNDGG
jgi:hypothetical protein